MNVISGNIRGLKLYSAKKPDLRPTKDRIKKSLFDILRFEIKGKNFLDLFGGTGQIGIEAFSQGASKVVIVELDSDNFSIIKKNINKIKIFNNIVLVNQDALNFLDNYSDKFDIIFLDPPYKSTNILASALEKITNLSYLPKVVAIETLTELKIPINNDIFSLRKKYKYGKISLSLYELRQV